MARGSLTFSEGQKLLAEILSAQQGGDPINPRAITQDDFDKLIQTAREAVEPLDYDIRNMRHQQGNGERVWAFINAHSDPATQMGTTRSPEEVSFIKRLLDAMFEEYNTVRMEVMAVDEGQALKVSRPRRRQSGINGAALEDEETNSQGTPDRGLKHSEVLSLLSSLVAEEWLEKSRDGFYSLSPRSLMELWSWLVATYNDPDEDGEWQHIKFCEACQEIMLEYFAYKKYKKNKAEKAASAPSSPGPSVDKGKDKERRPSSPSKALTLSQPLLNEDDERFLERLTSPVDDDHDDGPRPPLPPRVKTPDMTSAWDSDSDSFRKMFDTASAQSHSQATTSLISTRDKGKNALNRGLSFIKTKTARNNPSSSSKLAVPAETSVEREQDDLSRVLDDLNLAARNNRAFALSSESNELVRKFTLVLKDLVNGVPTAVNDLTSLLDDKDGTLSKNYEKLPSSLKKLVTQLPDKLSDSLAPELMAVAAGAQGLSTEEAAKSGSGGIKGAAKKLLIPKNLKDLVTKPGAVVSMLKGIMNALKLRWPAFMGTNVIWSLAIFLLLFVLWYCHKRGREVRLDKEKSDAEGNVGVVDGSRGEEEEEEKSKSKSGTGEEGLSCCELGLGQNE
ncbi:Nse1 non-SMC component of SMC5-6 complex domain containing protein [Rhypophila sp. PSN 637]